MSEVREGWLPEKEVMGVHFYLLAEKNKHSVPNHFLSGNSCKLLECRKEKQTPI